MVITGTARRTDGVRCGDTKMGRGWSVDFTDQVYALVPDAGQADVSEKYAYLLAAAPELLAFAQWAMDQFQGDSGTGDTYWSEFKEYLDGQSAIAKATQPESEGE